MRTLDGCSATKALAAAWDAANAIGLHVDGAHAAGDVHGENDGLVLRRQGDHGGGTGDGDEHRDQRQQKQQRRDVAAKSLARAHRLLHHAQTRIFERALLLAAQ